MESPKTPCLAGALAVGLLVLGSPVAAQSDLDELAAELIELRGGVEELNSELDRKKSQHKERMASLAAQRGELEATKKRKQLEIEELRRSLAKQRERARKAGVGGEALRRVVERAVTALKHRIRAGIPFKRSERVSELEDIEQQNGHGCDYAAESSESAVDLL